VSRTARRRATLAALVIVSLTLQAIGSLSFQLPLAQHVWQFADLTTAVVGSPISITLGLLGGLAAAVAYLRLTSQPDGAADPVAA
jgi:cation transporter-like permease